VRLVLFDIDGTLIDTGGAGTHALNLAFSEVFSIESAFDSIDMAGKTDPQIIKECLKKHAISPLDGNIPRLLGAYVKNLASLMRRDGREGLQPKSLKPGVMELLDFLLSTKGLRIGLLTGNIQEGAWIKLSSFAIHRYFSFGAFGSDHEDRTELLPVAVNMFRNISGIGVDYLDCVVVGDTPMDIGCAKPYGAYSVAVATGPYSAGELEASGANAVFETLPGGDEFLGLISS
jgi:phosphoglycolate phosphatase-like HAD superfamily hydrolase